MMTAPLYAHPPSTMLPAPAPSKPAAPASDTRDMDLQRAAPPPAELRMQGTRVPGIENAPAPAPPPPAAAPNRSRALKQEGSEPATNAIALPKRSPEDWVAEIRALRQAGRESEAEAALARLRQAYPEFAVPQDLIVKP